jgi:hypothetical protein
MRRRDALENLTILESGEKHPVTCGKVRISGLENAIGPSLQFRDLCVGQRRSALQRRRPFERCCADADPYAL